MDDKKHDRSLLILNLGTAFFVDFKKSLEAFSDEEQVEVCGTLLEIAERFEKEENYDHIYKNQIEPLLLKYRSKCRELTNRYLTDYFVKNSLKLFDLMRKHNIDDQMNIYLTHEEYKNLMQDIKRIISNHRHFTILLLPAEGDQPLAVAALLEKEDDTKEENKEFTTRRKALFLHYLNKQYKFASDKKPLAEIAHFLTGNNEDNLYKHFLNPLKVKGEDNALGEKALKKDLLYVKRYFERLLAKDIIEIIDKDLRSFD